MGRRFSNWLERRTAWQFAVIYLFLQPMVAMGAVETSITISGRFATVRPADVPTPLIDPP